MKNGFILAGAAALAFTAPVMAQPGKGGGGGNGKGGGGGAPAQVQGGGGGPKQQARGGGGGPQQQARGGGGPQMRGNGGEVDAQVRKLACVIELQIVSIMVLRGARQLRRPAVPVPPGTPPIFTSDTSEPLW